MTKQELIETLVINHKKRNISKAAAMDIVESFFDNLSTAFKRGRRFSYPGFGTFIVRRRKERKGVHPKTGKEMVFQASKTVVFKPAVSLKTKIN